MRFGLVYEITIPVTPHGKGRPRFSKTGIVYTPQKTASKEAEIRYWLHKDQAPKFFPGPVRVEIVAGFKRPKSAPKSRVFHIVKPDLTNIAKTVEDAGNGILWDDDKQIVWIDVKKGYSTEDFLLIRVSDEIGEFL